MNETMIETRMNKAIDNALDAISEAMGHASELRAEKIYTNLICLHQLLKTCQNEHHLMNKSYNLERNKK